MTEGIHTGDLESIHSLYIKYVPKRKMFSVEGMQARLRLAALDNNHHVDRQQATTRNGELRFKLQYSKPAGTYIAKPIRWRRPTTSALSCCVGLCSDAKRRQECTISRQHPSRPTALWLVSLLANVLASTSPRRKRPSTNMCRASRKITESTTASRCYHHHQCLNRDGRWGTQTDVRVTTFLNGVLFRVAPLLSSPSMPES